MADLKTATTIIAEPISEAKTIDMPTKFEVNLWNKSYYCKVVMPDGNHIELNSKEDLTYAQWQEKIKTAWDASQPQPEPKKPCICPKCGLEFECQNRGL